MRLLIMGTFTLLCLSACGQETEPRQIETTGTARVERKAEIFVVNFDIVEHREGRTESVEAVSKKLRKFRAELNRLAALKDHSIRLLNAETKTGAPEECFESHNDRFYPGDCTPEEFVTTLHLFLEGEPAQAAADTITLLSRLGAEDVSLGGFDVKNRAGAEMEARSLALADALETAEALAEQANALIGPPLRVTYGGDLNEYEFDFGTIEGSDTIRVTGSLVPPIPLTLPIGTVKFEAEVTAIFALREKASNN